MNLPIKSHLSSIKQIIVFFLFLLRENKFSKKYCLGEVSNFALHGEVDNRTWGRVLIGEIIHRFERKYNELCRERHSPIEFLGTWEIVSLVLILKKKGGNRPYVCLPFWLSLPGGWDILRKKGKIGKGYVDFQIKHWDTSVFWCCGLKKTSCSACLLFYKEKDKKRLFSMYLEKGGVLEVVLLRRITYLGGEFTWGGLWSRWKEWKLIIKWISSNTVKKIL